MSEVTVLSRTQRIIVDSTRSVRIVNAGPQGPPGPPGTGGIDGDRTLSFSQPVASAMWTIVHNLGKNPSVTVVDDGGNVVLADVQYMNLNTVQIYFTTPASGSAYFN